MLGIMYKIVRQWVLPILDPGEHLRILLLYLEVTDIQVLQAIGFLGNSMGIELPISIHWHITEDLP